jgi:hypothetical protein
LFPPKNGPDSGRASRDHALSLTTLACAAFLLIAIRAWHQSITIDEADSALFFALRDWPAHWFPASNNHLLNTIGMRFFIEIFGLSVFTVRLPALIGAAIYLWAMRDIVRSLAASERLQCLLFAFSVTNPLILDHLVAARGYSLALGFLALAVAVFLRSKAQRDRLCDPPRTQEHSTPIPFCASSSKAQRDRLCDPPRTQEHSTPIPFCGSSSKNDTLRIATCCCLSFLANFSFAIAAASLLAISLLPNPKRIRFAIPGLLLTAAVASHTLANWPKDQFVFGAQSWRETFSALAEASSYTPNEFLLNPHLLLLFQRMIPVAFAVLPFAMLVLLLVDLAVSPSTAQRLIFGAMLLALAGHAILHWYSKMLLPKDRTALWMLLFFQILAVMLAARPTAAIAQSIVGIFLLCHLACLRLDHFKEWKFDANSDRLFEAFECVAPYLRRDLATQHVYSKWPVVSAFNFYRVARQRWNFPVLVFEFGLEAPPPDRDVYFLEMDGGQEFIDREKLTVVFRDKLSAQVLAIRLPREKLADANCFSDEIRERH